MREEARKGATGRLNNVRSREIAQVKLFGSLFFPHFIILSCHGEKLYITISLSLYSCPSLFSPSYSLELVSAERTERDRILIQ